MLAGSYLLALISYAATTTMMYSLYVQKNQEPIVLGAQIFVFLGFGISNVIVLQAIKRFNLKTAVILGYVGIGLYELTILVTALVADQQIFLLSTQPFLWAINIIGSLLCGICNALIW